MCETLYDCRIRVATMEGRRRRGRHSLRWEDGVADDVKLLGENKWMNAARKGTFGGF